MRLDSHIDEAFRSRDVTIDAFTLTGESLDLHMRLCAEKMRAGELRPESIRVRLLQPRTDGDFKLATPVGDPEDRRALERLRTLRFSFTASISGVLRELQAVGQVASVSFEHRETPMAPMQKLYLFNGTEVLAGYYTVLRRPVHLEAEEQIEIYDVLGLGAALYHHSATGAPPDPESTAIVNRARRWYEHMWANAE